MGREYESNTRRLLLRTSSLTIIPIFYCFFHYFWNPQLSLTSSSSLISPSLSFLTERRKPPRLTLPIIPVRLGSAPCSASRQGKEKTPNCWSRTCARGWSVYTNLRFFAVGTFRRVRPRGGSIINFGNRFMGKEITGKS